MTCGSNPVSATENATRIVFAGCACATGATDAAAEDGDRDRPCAVADGGHG
jgi:hypothetical protein